MRKAIGFLFLTLFLITTQSYAQCNTDQFVITNCTNSTYLLNDVKIKGGAFSYLPKTVLPSQQVIIYTKTTSLFGMRMKALYQNSTVSNDSFTINATQSYCLLGGSGVFNASTPSTKINIQLSVEQPLPGIIGGGSPGVAWVDLGCGS